MKLFKTIDLFINITLIAGFAAYSFLKQDQGLLFIGYFVVGGWQVISMEAHAYNRCFMYKTGSRYNYHWVTIISLVTLPFGSFIILLFAAPFMAIYYTWLCYHEVYVKMQRPLAVLK